MVRNSCLLFALRAEGGREGGGCGCGENKICCHLTASKLKISQRSWSHGALLSFHGRQNKGRFFSQQSTGKSNTYINQEGRNVCLHFKQVLFLGCDFPFGPLWTWKAVNNETGSSKHPCSHTHQRRLQNMFVLLNALIFSKSLPCCCAVLYSCDCKGPYINVHIRVYPWLPVLCKCGMKRHAQALPEL